MFIDGPHMFPALYNSSQWNMTTLRRCTSIIRSQKTMLSFLIINSFSLILFPLPLFLFGFGEASLQVGEDRGQETEGSPKHKQCITEVHSRINLEELNYVTNLVSLKIDPSSGEPR